MKKLKILICLISLFYCLYQFYTPKIVILATYHKPAFLFKSDIVVPIQGGRNLEKAESKDGFLSKKDIFWMHKNMIGDNTGENISIKNRRYSELSAIYWAYKNYEKLGNPDYIGLIHYRRQFLLNAPHPEWIYKNPYYIVPKPQADHLEKIGLTKQNLRRILKKHDIIVHRIQIPKKSKNMEYIYRKNWPFRKNEILNYQKVMDIVLKHYPDMADDVKTFQEENKEALANMFIMPRKEFKKYAQFMFRILDEIDSGLDFSNQNITQRVVGVWGEQLSSFYFHHLEKQGLIVKESKVVFIGDAEVYAELPTK